MMKFSRIYALLLRHYYISLRSWDRLSEAFFWPTIDIVVWGLTSTYFSKTAHFSNFILFILSGLLFWTLLYKGQQEISTALLEELWNKNLVNLFSSPLKFWEWITSIMILAIIKTGISFIFISLLAFLLYKMNIFIYGFYLLPFIFLLFLTSWSVGFFVTGLILRYTTKVQTLSWSTMAIISPFSAVYYSLSVLPTWAQNISIFIAPSYVFEGMRQVATTGKIDPMKLYISFALNIIYMVLSLLYLKMSFNKVLEKGLVKIT